MGRPTQPTFRRAESVEPIGHQPVFADRWYGKLVLLATTVVLFSLAFAPFKQFYMAWFALAPWLVMVRHTRSSTTAFLWSWLGGTLFFIANMWWLAYVTGPGMIALIAVLGLYWGVAGAVIRGAKLLEPHGPWQTAGAVLLIAAIWAALEWFRGTWPLGGLAWSYMGHSQSPILAVCQIADLGGVYLVSFWAALLNAFFAMFFLARLNIRPVAIAGAGVLVATAAVVGYGFFRLSQPVNGAGPKVLVVQPNYLQDNSGDKGAKPGEIIKFHVDQTIAALAHDPSIDLVVWSETMMPPLNKGARDYFGSLGYSMLEDVHRVLAQIAQNRNVAILAGGAFEDKLRPKGRGDVADDRRNSAYFYTPRGVSDLRYDKIHLVPFGETLPFRSTIPPLYSLFVSMSPYGDDEFTLRPGDENALTVFPLASGWRFVTPICFEDMDAVLLRRMFAPAAGKKRADFIVNITNDGWFKYNEMPQHFQAAIFRSIENRVPTARSVNTGISGFIDSDGRATDLIPASTEGVSTHTLALDGRVSFYTRFGDVFAEMCMAATSILAIASLVRWVKTRNAKRRSAA
ncbi:MAG TPA: apolipoprotein N-acyltransferase [Tepidisphaeraceae bacterium]|jgi:apolipoprotein N-acyltransferase